MLEACAQHEFKEYILKAVGICGVSAGPFGGARVIENLAPVMRELGFVIIFEDVNFGIVQRFLMNKASCLIKNISDVLINF